VHTLSLPVSEDLSRIYARANVLAITGTLANMGKGWLDWTGWEWS